NYLYSPTGGTAGVWESWQAPLLDGPGWSRSGGGESLAEVLADVTELAFILEVTTFTGLEAGLDNVRLNPIPVPAALWLFGSGLLGLVGIARRRQI
ncbi:MAG: VPLPA-CTERM sorting domain-containing protein, partial [Gammaproteobacteria bacterium]|nr:VPLPA-CTERM sorting domain-containing protein [Gammaproteobacteria bacterium]